MNNKDASIRLKLAKARSLLAEMQERIEDDYNDFLVADETEVNEFIEPAKAYVNYISQLIEKYLAQPE